ncbi:hypothetical protein HCN44_005206 [Aphidius gifuensis]|uniref:Uncharacterized protein n=2 Tax=Aphidius gifuensis TaxID=684658 RepID=A0A834XUR6_APHGI|nr:hypothetical protein HCN44_005206 [Aphidius gifuensis]
MGQRGPVFCKTKFDFNIEKIDTIKDSLKENWTDFHEDDNNDNDYYLWKQEWKKHGSCLVENNHQNTIFGYFKKGIDLLKNYQMKDILKKANIHPGNIYKILHEKKKVYLEEISICMNRDMNFIIDCDGVGTLINSLPNLSLKYLDQTNEEIISPSTNKN